jgi:hypothetical protein
VSLIYPASRRQTWAVDLGLLVWTVLWILVGSLVAIQMRDLRELSDSLTFAGRSLEDAGNRLSSLEGVPFVGPDLARVGAQLREGGRRAVHNGATTRQSIDSTSLLLAVAVAAVPTLPLLALYVPIRWARARDVRAVRRGMAESGEDPAFLEFLARRAMERLPYRVLRDVTPTPWRDLETGRYLPLAEAELRRLGLSRRVDAQPSSPRIPTQT